jgi:hypothetical protein
MQILARVSVAAGLLAAAGAAAVIVAFDGRTPDNVSAIAEPVIDDEPAAMVASDDPPPEAPAVIVEAPDGSDGGATWLPPGYVETLSRDQTDDLATLVEAWMTNHDQPAIDYKRGVTFVESEEDRGDDGPYPKSAAPEAIHACGSQALWLRDYIQKRIANNELSCWNNICSYGGMEYAPSGTLVFKEINGAWTLIAWTQVYEAALVQDAVDKNYRDVIAGLIKLRGAQCAGEPPGNS